MRLPGAAIGDAARVRRSPGSGPARGRRGRARRGRQRWATGLSSVLERAYLDRVVPGGRVRGGELDGLLAVSAAARAPGHLPGMGACTGGSRLWLPGLRLAFKKAI
jgi:hypothetical protein